jgi:hypothetical protein
MHLRWHLGQSKPQLRESLLLYLTGRNGLLLLLSIWRNGKSSTGRTAGKLSGTGLD